MGPDGQEARSRSRLPCRSVDLGSAGRHHGPSLGRAQGRSPEFRTPRPPGDARRASAGNCWHTGNRFAFQVLGPADARRRRHTAPRTASRAPQSEEAQRRGLAIPADPTLENEPTERFDSREQRDKRRAVTQHRRWAGLLAVDGAWRGAAVLALKGSVWSPTTRHYSPAVITATTASTRSARPGLAVARPRFCLPAAVRSRSASAPGTR